MVLILSDPDKLHRSKDTSSAGVGFTVSGVGFYEVWG